MLDVTAYANLAYDLKKYDTPQKKDIVVAARTPAGHPASGAAKKEKNFTRPPPHTKPSG